ncbi:MAG: IS607 family transposase [Leptolyngbya sp. LCM1.Bin17]|nr:MAG: IS607 family transposase [Leptolyngbya sp. LCM1.Bin17]
MRLSDYTAHLGVSYKIAWRMGKRNDIPHRVELLSAGTIIVHLGEGEASPGARAAIYARVSSAENKKTLDAQAERLSQYATVKGYQTVAVVKEVGSGLNDQRKKLDALLRKEGYDILIVEHSDRLARFGVRYIDALLERSGIKLEIINTAKSQRDELMQDLVAIITSFAARLYGQRRARRKTEKIVKELQDAAS